MLVWKDNWLPDNNQRPTRGSGAWERCGVPKVWPGRIDKSYDFRMPPDITDIGTSGISGTPKSIPNEELGIEYGLSFLEVGPSSRENQGDQEGCNWRGIGME
ncbi:unnamed protein product [Cochlearia groenlandica]